MKPLFLLLFALPLPAQTWFKAIPAESTSISVTMPAGTQFRIGSGTCWSATLTAKAVTYTPFSFGTSNNFGISDPCPGVVKELDVLETSSAQTITVSNPGGTCPGTMVNTGGDAFVCRVTIPALPLPPPPPPPLAPTVVSTATYTCTIVTVVQTMSDGSYNVSLSSPNDCPAPVIK